LLVPLIVLIFDLQNIARELVVISGVFISSVGLGIAPVCFFMLKKSFELSWKRIFLFVG
jgi:hypothetical protein